MDQSPHFLRDPRKALLTLVLLGIWLGGSMQRWAFVDDPATKPAVFDLFAPWGMWPAYLLLTYPFIIMPGMDPLMSNEATEFMIAALYCSTIAWVLFHVWDRSGFRLPRLLAPAGFVTTSLVLVGILAFCRTPRSWIGTVVSDLIFVAIVIATYAIIALCSAAILLKPVRKMPTVT